MKRCFLFIFLGLITVVTIVPAQKKELNEINFSGYIYGRNGSLVAGAEVCLWQNREQELMAIGNRCVMTESDGGFSLKLSKQKGASFIIFADNRNLDVAESALVRVPALQIKDKTGEADLTETAIKFGIKTLVANAVANSQITATELNIEVCRLDAALACNDQKDVFKPGSPQRPYELLTPDAPFVLKIKYERGGEWAEWQAVAKNNSKAGLIKVELISDDGSINVELNK